ncbi:Terminal nucleotidyltransferase 4A (DNA polymerase sigma) (LAK-1) (Non-canonical poly(A) RNA polymerase PAPD7) (PAP-associated domain-containing protein 7) (TRAMP-like complex polyadenylate polymerase) (Terminal guanylyltransferase) (Terminal uridylyltransferase 5) (TUTase 5) (Topoisomerase-related function protein 4-1) (TRF4-1) [Durusdinium trenchii]|uniref:Uncharacterized protein n=1 Tax=Durusdinium trenchii TaxID=1381693 RepID=A0ABP0MX90_9DINO
MVMQSLDDAFDAFDDGYGVFDEDGGEAEDPQEGFSSLVDGANEILMEDQARNERQARRNVRIRGLLKTFRDSSEAAPKPFKMEGFAKVAGPQAPQSEHPPWWVEREHPTEASLRLHEELIDFTEFLRPTVIEAAMRDAWVHSIEEAAKSLWPEVRVHIFGSTSTSLNLPSADIDVAIVNVTNLRVTTAMKQLAERMLERQEVSKVEIIQSAKVPVMKVQQRTTGLMADIVINKTDGLDTAKFVREQMAIFPAMPPLVLFLKLFLAQRNLHETYMGGLGSYLLVCVVLSFLQLHPSAQQQRLHSASTLGKLLLDFFRYYGQEFRYATQGISVLNGGALFDRQQRGFTARTRTGQATLCLESPSEPSLDIGSRVFKIGIIRAAFNHGYHVLSTLFLSKEPIPGSLLCPYLLRRDHPLIAQRFRLFNEQPAPFLELVGRPESDEEREKGPAEPIMKKKKLDTAPLNINVAMEEPVPDPMAESLTQALDFLAAADPRLAQDDPYGQAGTGYLGGEPPGPGPGSLGRRAAEASRADRTSGGPGRR